MPFYDFRCRECGHPFTLRASFEEKDAGLHPACPVCKAEETQQVLSAGVFVGQATGNSDRPSPFAGPACGCGPGGCCG